MAGTLIGSMRVTVEDCGLNFNLRPAGEGWNRLLSIEGRSDSVELNLMGPTSTVLRLAIGDTLTIQCVRRETPDAMGTGS